MAEETILNEGGVQVTSARYIVGNQTYVLNGITSVSIHEEHPKRTGSIILIIIGLLCIPTIPSNSAGILFVLLFVGGGVLLWKIKKASYAVRLVTASGQSDTIKSSDGAYINRIVDALNNAIVHRG